MGKSVLIVFFVFVCSGLMSAQLRRQAYPYLQVGVGPELSWVLNKPWISDQVGPGFRHGLGGVFVAEYRINPIVAVLVQTGYRRWGTRRKIYLDENQINEKKSVLENIPIELGAKFYPGYNNWFVSPLAGYGFFSGKLHDDQGVSDVRKTSGWLFGVGVGKAWQNRGKVTEASLQYDYASRAGWIDFTGPVHTVKLTVLVGFRSRLFRRLDNPCPKF